MVLLMLWLGKLAMLMLMILVVLVVAGFRTRAGALLMGCSRSALQGVPEEACSGPQLRGGGWRLGGTRDADAVGAVGLVCPALAYAIPR